MPAIREVRRAVTGDQPSPSPAGPEAQRVRAVYERYDADPRTVAKWDPGNPGNAVMWEEAIARIPFLLRNAGVRLDEATILDVGCGRGTVLGRLVQYGAQPGRLYGVDVQEARIEQARAQCPGVNLRRADAQHLEFADHYFDAVLCINLFGSILDGSVAETVAVEVRRVVKLTGVIIWCDIRYPNPWNSNVRGYSQRMIRRLFPGCRIVLHPITVLPQLARRLGRLTSVLYPRLARIPALCVRYLGVIQPDHKNREPDR